MITPIMILMIAGTQSHVVCTIWLGAPASYARGGLQAQPFYITLHNNVTTDITVQDHNLHVTILY